MNLETVSYIDHPFCVEAIVSYDVLVFVNAKDKDDAETVACDKLERIKQLLHEVLVSELIGEPIVIRIDKIVIKTNKLGGL
jgi:hypothetical protein